MARVSSCRAPGAAKVNESAHQSETQRARSRRRCDCCPVLRAIIFDFDGVILDTETPLFDAWARTFEHFGVEPIGHDRWVDSLGRHEDDVAVLKPIELLEDALGRPVNPSEVQRVRRRFRDETLDRLPIQPGVDELLEAAAELGLSVAIASSSPNDWIERHLKSRGWLHRFPVVACAGNGVPGKPNPAVYLEAARRLEVAPGECLAIEDSPHGTAAAKGAGAICVAVPTRLSKSLDFSQADMIVESITEIDLTRWM
jgi:HAD superfamily hydrolase (TIGR01509 family)